MKKRSFRSRSIRPNHTVYLFEIEDPDWTKVEVVSNTTKHNVSAIEKHRVIDGSIEFLVKWQTGQTTWEPEEVVQLDAPSIVAEYWRGDKREKALYGNDKKNWPVNAYDVFAIVGHKEFGRGNKRMLYYRVEWLGAGLDKTTWELAAQLKGDQPQLVEMYKKLVAAEKERSAAVAK